LNAKLESGERKWLLERVDDAAVVQLYADGFGKLALRERTLLWHLCQASLAGRDVYLDQRYRHNLQQKNRAMPLCDTCDYMAEPTDWD
jgi:dipeptidyl-peptidase-3